MYAKNIWLDASKEKIESIMEFCEQYKDYISKGKTERVCVEESIKIAEAHGYKNLKEVKEVKAGDKVYLVNILQERCVEINKEDF